MKIEELKHNHSLTDLLKILLFTILMLAPIGMVATRCLYVIANKNAYQSYSNEMVEQQISISSTSQLIENQTYIMNYKEYETTDYSYIPYITYNSINVDWSDYTTADVSNVIAFRVRTNDNFMQLKNSDNSTINLFNVWGVSLNTLTFNFKSAEFNSTNALLNLTITGIYYNTAKLDNVFEYSVSQLEESNLFNWTENTAIFSGINAMNSQLGINSPAITIILTYWLILTCIYIIIDIVLKLFTYLTHMIGNRKS